jgi:hypothetical protein
MYTRLRTPLGSRRTLEFQVVRVELWVVFLVLTESAPARLDVYHNTSP